MWALGLLAACAPDERPRVEMCERTLAVLEAGRSPRVVERGAAPELPDTVILRYRAEGVPGEKHLTCRFAPDGPGRLAPELMGVHSERDGELSAAALFFLREYGLGDPTVVLAAGRPGGLAPLPYLLQQLANAIAPSAIYALLATGYALIYGITGRINLAFGDFTTVGAFAALNGFVLAALGLAGVAPVAAGAGLLLAVLAGIGLGAVLAAAVFAPLRERSSQALLIATIGLAIVVSEGLRLLVGAQQRWLEPFLDRPLTLLAGAEGEVMLSLGQLVLAGIAAATIAGVVVVLRRTAFGRAYRACADDPEAAALLGVDTDRTLRRACVLGSVVAATAGFVVAMRYGIVGFGMGTLWGFKALAAAVVGGIGSVPGAALGGVLIGLLEGLWAGYLPGAYREVALFGLLALMLVLRPHGLFGEAAGAAENPNVWGGRPRI